MGNVVVGGYLGHSDNKMIELSFLKGMGKGASKTHVLGLLEDRLCPLWAFGLGIHS